MGERNRRKRVGILGALAISALGLSAAVGAESLASEQRRAKNFTFEDINPGSPSHGRKLAIRSLYEQRGLVLQFTASWCEFCRKKLPAMQELHAKRDTPLVLVAADEYWSAEPILILAERAGLTAPILFVPAEKTEQLERYYRYEVLPATYLIDRKGVIRKLHEGAIPPERLIEEIRAELGLPLAKRKPAPPVSSD